MVATDRRIGWIFVAFIALLVAAIARAGYLGVVKAGSLKRAAVTEHIVNEPLPAPRGAIADRHGVQLALSEAANEIVADPYLINQSMSTAQVIAAARLIAPLVGLPSAKVLAMLTKPHTGYAVLAHQVSPGAARRILALKVNGISTAPEVKRVYPLSWTASQVLGGVNSHGGDDGLEFEYNAALSGRGGERRIVNDAIGQTVSVDDVRPMHAGRSLKLTLDSALQNYVEQVLVGVGARYRPRGATAIVMNPDTGAILALANWPRINANDPGGAPSADLMDKGVGYSYEPGSTFKAITVSGALQDGVVNPSTEISVPSV
ncbi:MAG: penicillin-binding transpeptidase domain-containing protein, partial [Trebonia sp.]